MARVGRVMEMGGQRFTIVGSRRLKREANQWADRLRDDGFNARVTEFKDGWYVWKGPKSKR